MRRDLGLQTVYLPQYSTYIPSWLLQVLAVLWTSNVPHSMQYQCVELFSGKGEVSRSFIEAGKKTAYFDWIHDHRAMDIQSPAGMAFFDCIYIYIEDILKSTLPIKVSFGVTSAEYHRYQFEIGAMITCNHPCQGFASLWSLLWPQTHCSCLHRSAHPGRLFLEGHPSGQ